MKILLLNSSINENLHAARLITWLRSKEEEVAEFSDMLDLDILRSIDPEMILSYGYNYILKKEILEYPKDGCINLHIALLPYNRGSDPNIWSFLEDTPKGVTIHYMDERIDTGDIIVQKEVVFDAEKETLRTSYDHLHAEMFNLFRNNWEDIKTKSIALKKQGTGTMHYKKDRKAYTKFIGEKGWDTPVKELIGRLAGEK